MHNPNRFPKRNLNSSSRTSPQPNLSSLQRDNYFSLLENVQRHPCEISEVFKSRLRIQAKRIVHSPVDICEEIKDYFIALSTSRRINTTFEKGRKNCLDPSGYHLERIPRRFFAEEFLERINKRNRLARLIFIGGAMLTDNF